MFKFLSKSVHWDRHCEIFKVFDFFDYFPFVVYCYSKPTKIKKGLVPYCADNAYFIW